MKPKLTLKLWHDVEHAQAYGCLLFVQVGYHALFVGSGFPWGLRVEFKPQGATVRRNVRWVQFK